MDCTSIHLSGQVNIRERSSCVESPLSTPRSPFEYHPFVSIVQFSPSLIEAIVTMHSIIASFVLLAALVNAAPAPAPYPQAADATPTAPCTATGAFAAHGTGFPTGGFHHGHGHGHHRGHHHKGTGGEQTSLRSAKSVN